MIEFSDQEIVGEKLVLDRKDEAYYLGHNLTLRNCTVVLRVIERALVISEVHFIDCTIDVKQELRGFRWSGASLTGCRFKGRLFSSDFGYWRESAATWEHASISDCDFSSARLDCCRFHDCDPRTLKFPRWPCFTILDPIGNSPKLRSVDWPGIFGSIVIDDLHDDPASTVALTYHAPSVAKRNNTTAEALRAVLEKFDCIVY
jgi:hypothetical protein